MTLLGATGGGIGAYLAFSLGKADHYLELIAIGVALTLVALLVTWAFIPGKRLEKKEDADPVARDNAAQRPS